VVNQTYQNIEYILVDGNSTDGTLDIIKKYKNISPQKLNYISENDDGSHHAINKGIILATGEVIGILCADDWYELDAVENVVKQYLISGECIIYGLLNHYKDGVKIITTAHSHENLKNKMIEFPTCFFSKNLFEKYGMFNNEFDFCGDYELVLRFYTKGVKFVQLDKVLTNFRIGGRSLQKKNRIFVDKDVIKLKYKYGVISKKIYRKKILNINLKIFVKKIKKFFKNSHILFFILKVLK